jgi:hypothetical protein
MGKRRAKAKTRGKAWRDANRAADMGGPGDHEDGTPNPFRPRQLGKLDLRQQCLFTIFTILEGSPDAEGRRPRCVLIA